MMRRTATLFIPVLAFGGAIFLSSFVSSPPAEAARARRSETAGFCTIAPARLFEFSAPPTAQGAPVPIPGAGGARLLLGGAFNAPGGYGQNIRMTRSPRVHSFSYLSSHAVSGNTGDDSTGVVNFDQFLTTSLNRVGAPGAPNPGGGVTHFHLLVSILNGGLETDSVNRAIGPRVVFFSETVPDSVQTEHLLDLCTPFTGLIFVGTDLGLNRFDGPRGLGLPFAAGKALEGLGDADAVKCSRN